MISLVTLNMRFTTLFITVGYLSTLTIAVTPESVLSFLILPQPTNKLLDNPVQQQWP
jgi:hypothetical protein